MKYQVFSTLLFLSISFKGYGQSLVADRTALCVGEAVTFKLDSLGPMSDYTSAIMDFGDGQSVDLLRFAEPQIHRYFYATGKFYPKLTLVSNQGMATDHETDMIWVKSAPRFEISLEKVDTLCFKGHTFSWSAPPIDIYNTPIRAWKWDWNDGTYSSHRTTNKTYSYSGKYMVSLKCLGRNGCWGTVSKAVIVPDSFSVNFLAQSPERLSVRGTKVNFVNLTTLDSSQLNSWIWDWGIGKGTHRDTFYMDSTGHYDRWWSGFSRTYRKDGYHSPKLLIISKDGCKDSIILRDHIRVINSQMDIKWFPDTSCYTYQGGQGITMNMPRKANATHLKWIVFDSLIDWHGRINLDSWSPTFQFSSPGYYNVGFSVTEPPLEQRDTVVCFLKVKGPKAQVLRNDYKPFRPIKRSVLERLKNDIHFRQRTQTTSVDFYTIKKIDSVLIDSVAAYFNAPLKLGRRIENICGQDTIWEPLYNLEPTSYQYIYRNYEAVDSGTWSFNQPIPDDTLYQPAEGRAYTYNIHDSNLFHPSPNNLVSFTNNSTKYRLFGRRSGEKPASKRYAWDNIPGEFPDKARNPNYPWASDSMQYFWNFGDIEAQSCTSSVSTPNILCKYSTEVAPKHLYKKMGVYQAMLVVSDTVCNCKDTNLVNIVMRRPDLHPAPIYEGLNWHEQVALDGIERKGKRGFMLKGGNCVGNYFPNWPDFSETNLPEEILDDFWLVLDVKDQCDTIWYNYKTQGITKDSFYLSCDWLSKKELAEMGGVYYYKTGGWKSIGVIAKVGSAYDTLFLKNYKWVSDPLPRVTMKTVYDSFDDQVELQLSLDDTTTYHDSTRIWSYYLWEGFSGDNLISDSILAPESLRETVNLTLQGRRPVRYVVHGQSKISSALCFHSQYGLIPNLHQIWFRADTSEICAGKKLDFFDKVGYNEIYLDSTYITAGDTSFSQNAKSHWKLASGYRMNRELMHYGHSSVQRQRWQLNPVYKLPEFEEVMAWDFDEDSVFDAYGHQPTWVYRRPGTYVPWLYIRDSTGVWARRKHHSPIKVYGVQPEIVPKIRSLAKPICTNTEHVFEVVMMPSAIDSLERLFWQSSPDGQLGNKTEFTWYSGDRNDYSISLHTESYFGCKEKFVYGPIKIRGPRAGFRIEQNTDSCLALELALKNEAVFSDTLK